MAYQDPDHVTIYHYAAAGAQSRVLADALYSLIPASVRWVTCEAESELPQQGGPGLVVLFDDIMPAAIPGTLACVHFVRDPDKARLQGIYQRTVWQPCRVGRLVDEMCHCLRLSAYARWPRQIDFGHGLRLDWQGGQLVHPRLGQIGLTGKECDILLALYEAEGQRMPRRALLESVWSYASDVETHTLETHIYRLRQKIEDDPGNPAILLTHGDGYALNIG